MKKQKNSILSLGFYFLLALICIFLSTNCGKDDDTTPAPPPPPPACQTYELKKQSGDNQTAEVSKDLPKKIVVRLTDCDNVPKANVNVTFKVTAGGGSAPSAKLTDSNGDAEITWKLGQTVGEQLLQAFVKDGDFNSNTVEFKATGKKRDCIKEDKTHSPSDITYMPPHKNNGGNNDFSGNGPSVTVKVDLVTSSDKKKLIAKVYMKALETKPNGAPQPDHTTAEGTKDFTIYTAPSDRIIESILSEKSFKVEFRDENGHADNIASNMSGLINEYVVVGDTDGPDAGVKTKVTVKFNAVKFKLKEVGDCN